LELLDPINNCKTINSAYLDLRVTKQMISGSEKQKKKKKRVHILGASSAFSIFLCERQKGPTSIGVPKIVTRNK